MRLTYELKEQILKMIRTGPVIDNYSQLACGFDIETSSFSQNDKNYATMYIWQMSFATPSEMIVIHGRTWSEWISLMSEIKNTLYYMPHKPKLVIYVHNLSYEFYWIMSKLYINKVFARKRNKPIYCQSDNILFKCSYFLSNMSLRNLADEYGYSQKENMDYSLKRFWFTPLTKEEISYSETDVIIIAQYILDEIKRNGRIQDIPLTSTGYARRYCLNHIRSTTYFVGYKKNVQNMVDFDYDLFQILYNAYSGGYTHSNFTYTGITWEHIIPYDFNSSYPGVMVRKKFPSKFRQVTNPTVSKLNEFIKEGKYAIVMRIKLKNLMSIKQNSILSVNKCKAEGEVIVDNGRLRHAKYVDVTLTDLDYKLLKLFYQFDKDIEIVSMYISQYRYLPKSFIEAILKLYHDKTTLKGTEDPILKRRYAISKALLNSLYGMCVTNPLNDEIIFNPENTDDVWSKVECDPNEGLEKYKNSIKLFTAYQWGVWVSAWARYELLTTVSEIDDIVIYCDTDSIKAFDNPKLYEAIERKNKIIHSENLEIMKIYHLTDDQISPLQHELGLWDKEKIYKYFKTLGAKRYVFTKEKTPDEFEITIAGVPKDKGAYYIARKAEEEGISPFELFDDELDIPAETFFSQNEKFQLNKLSMQYIANNPFEMEAIDYLGNKGVIKELTYVYAKPVGFTMDMQETYLSLIGILSKEEPTGGECSLQLSFYETSVLNSKFKEREMSRYVTRREQILQHTTSPQFASGIQPDFWGKVEW